MESGVVVALVTRSSGDADAPEGASVAQVV